MTTRSFRNRLTNVSATVRTGYTGSVGTVGFTGSIGSLGYTGSSGIQGSIGYTGSGFDSTAPLVLNGNSSITGSDATNYKIGYKYVPQNIQSTAYTLVNSDEGKHIYYTGGANTITIPTDGNTTGGNFAVGTTITIVNHGSGNITVSHAGSLFMAGNTTSASRQLSSKGVASILKVASNIWYISGGGLT